jgi:hypothetical protein
MGHFFVFGCADRPIEEAHIDEAIRITFYILGLKVCNAREESQIEDFVYYKDLISNV